MAVTFIWVYTWTVKWDLSYYLLISCPQDVVRTCRLPAGVKRIKVANCANVQSSTRQYKHLTSPSFLMSQLQRVLQLPPLCAVFAFSFFASVLLERAVLVLVGIRKEDVRCAAVYRHLLASWLLHAVCLALFTSGPSQSLNVQALLVLIHRAIRGNGTWRSPVGFRSTNRKTRSAWILTARSDPL